jgi:LmbE family N-acetylglucosaminyl deacetylase
MVLVAHPDDETTGGGALLNTFSELLLVHVTDGAPRRGSDAQNAGCASFREYAVLRRRELEAAVALAGWSAEQVVSLGYPDQEAALAMADAARGTAALIAEWRPDVLLTQPYEGGHPDHDATAFAAHAAVALLHPSARRPRLVEMASYHDGDGDGVTTFQEFLPCVARPVTTVHLDDRARALKRQMLDAYRSQAATLASFRDDVERYRAAPSYDFTRPPHPGRLNYERFDWGATGESWREQARRALSLLGLPERAPC